MKKRNRILFVLENYYPNIGGVETLFKSLVENIASENTEVIVLTRRLDKDNSIKEVNGNVSIYRMPVGNRYVFTFLSILPAILLGFKVDLIHTTSYNAGIPAFIASVITRRKVIITFHEVWGKLWFKLPFISKVKRMGFYLFEKFLLNLKFDLFVGVSDFTKKKLIGQGIDNSRVTRIYNGIDNYDTKSIDSDIDSVKYRYLYFGRLGISKGLDLLLHAIKILSEGNHDFEVKLILPSSKTFLNSRINKLIENYKIEKFILFDSDLDKNTLETELLLADCIVIPSYSEGFCFGAVESIALGKGIISSDQGALKEVVSGKFIKMKEFNVQGLVDAMIDAKKERWVHTPVIKFLLDDTITQYQKLYKDLLGDD